MSPSRTNVARRPFPAARRIPLRSIFTLLVGIALTCGGCEQAADQSARLVAEGLSLAERGDHAAAFARFERAGIADPSSPRGWVAAAELATDLGDYERAERGFSEAMCLDPDNVLWQQKRAEVRQMAGHTERAKGDYSAVVQRDPTRSSAWYNRGSIHAVEGNLPQAHADVEQAFSQADTPAKQ